MSQIVDVPGIGEVEFPDGMSDDQIAEAIRLSQPQPTLSKPPVPQGERPGRVEAGGRGLAQGATMGFGDELAGVRRMNAAPGFWRSALSGALSGLPFVGPLLMPTWEDRRAAAEEWKKTGRTQSLGDGYRAGRDQDRAANAAAAAAHPTLYTTGEIGGAVLPALIPGGQGRLVATGSRLVRALKAGGRFAGQGAIQGAGYSDATSPEDLARDSGVGAAFGVTGRTLGSGLGRLASGTSRWGRSLVARGTQRAQDQAAKEVGEEIATASGRAGAEVQKGSRYIENLIRLEGQGALTAEQKATLEALRASGALQNLEQAVATSTLEALPGQAAAAAARKAELAALQQASPFKVADRVKQLLTPQPKADTKSFLKSYAEPLVWAYLGNKGAELAGATPDQRAVAAATAGLIGGRTRAGKALWNRLTRPAHQVAIGKAIEKAGVVGESMPIRILHQLLGRGVPAAATAAAVATPEDTQ